MATNPVVRGFSPDPSVCRVGEHFYLATSSFEFFPAIPIRRSTDLVHWELVGHAVVDPALLRPEPDGGAFVLFAPTIRHHDGAFWVSCTNIAPRVPGDRGSGFTGNFVVHAEDPAGPWSDPVWVDTEGFDPSLFWDDDGTCYYTRRTLELGGGHEGHGPVVQAELDPLTGELLTDIRPITPGRGGFCSNDIEGPHLYKVDGRYYLLGAEGGTEHGHMVTVARSDSPWGPFEPAPHNPLITHRHLTLLEVQCTGHADLVEAPDGSWWALLLAQRERWMQPQLLGRETFLAPVSWRDGWPYVDTDVIGTEVDGPDLPAGPESDGPIWMSRQGPVAEVSATDRSLVLGTHPAGLDDDGQVAAAFLRQQEYDAALSATLGTAPDGIEAGLTAYITPDRHYDLTVTGRLLTFRRRAADLVTEEQLPLAGDGPVTLRVACDGTTYRFTASLDGHEVFTGEGAAKLLGSEVAPGFGSVRIGLLARGPEGGTVSFDDIDRDGLS